MRFFIYHNRSGIGVTSFVTPSAWSISFFRVEKMCHIKQRRRHCFIQPLSDDEDDKGDKYDSGFSMI